MRGRGAEVPAAIWLSERRLTTGNGEGGRKEGRTRGEHNSASRTAGFAFGDLGMPPGRCVASLSRRTQRTEARCRSWLPSGAKLLLRGLAIVTFGRRWALVQQPLVPESLPQK